MVLAIILIFLLGPFLALGVRWKWRVALALWALLGIFAAYQWIVPAPAYYDQQDEMGHDALVTILLGFLIAWPLAFAIGCGVTAFRDRREQNSANEATK